MEKFEIDEALYDSLCKKLIKTRKEYNDLKDRYAKLEVENKFLTKEIKNLKETNVKLLKFQDKKERIISKIKKVLAKIDNI
ncbi:hypothetical protein [Candidatus Ruminimicrobiellum ovillum]|uniref:hypothetical protein n=1 Tax=Candidatus Ruminimicrobiellum ovillum TaxID=1947927 RepID=UPI00355A091D